MNLTLSQDYSISDIIPEDKPSFLEHFKEREIYERTLNIPFPYKESDADWWINFVTENTLKQGRSVSWAIRDSEGILIGGIGFLGLVIGKSHRAELGYWLAKNYWNRGIMANAVSHVCTYAAQEFKLIRIDAHIFSFNQASARVLEKCGFVLEGNLRNYYRKDGKIFDGQLYAKIYE